MRNQSIFIFGGPDRCGKTTVAKALAKMLNIPYFKPTNQQWFAMNDPGAFAKQTEWGEPKMLDFIVQTGISVVIDRGFPCDWAYSKVLERDTAWQTIYALDDEYARLGATFVVMLRDTYNNVDEEWKKMTPEVLKELDHEYRNFAAMTKMNSLIISSNHPPEGDILRAHLFNICQEF